MRRGFPAASKLHERLVKGPTWNCMIDKVSSQMLRLFFGHMKLAANDLAMAVLCCVSHYLLAQVHVQHTGRSIMIIPGKCNRTANA